MAMRVDSMEAAGVATGFGRNRMPELRDLIDIPEFHVHSRHGHKTKIAWDESIDSAGKLWDALCANGWLVDGQVDLKRFRRLKTVLADRKTEIPADVVLAELRQSGEVPTTRRYGIVFAADADAVRAAMRIANRSLGRPDTDRANVRNSRPMALDDFIAQCAPDLDRLPNSRRDPVHGALAQEPNERWLGRAAQLCTPVSRSRAGLYVIACGATMSGGHQGNGLALLENLDGLSGGRGLVDDAIIDAMRAIVVGGATGATDKSRLRAVVIYGTVRKALREWLDGVDDAQRTQWHSCVPPDLPSEVAYWQPADDDDDGEGSSLEKATRRSDDSDRQAREVSEGRDRILSALELRKSELDLIENVLASEVARLRKAIDGGGAPTLPAGRFISFPVVREDGTLGVGNQVHQFEIDTVAGFRRRCIAVVGRRPEIDIRLSSADRAIGRAPDAPILPPGRLHDPRDDARLVIGYRRTLPTAGGECFEPFWVKLFRYSALRRHRWLTRDMEEIGGRLAKRLRCSDGRFPPQLLSWEVETDAQLNTWCVEHLGLVIWPMVEFCHGFAIGRACVRAGLLGGLRIGESTQARDDPGAFRAVRLKGRLAFRLTAIFKGRIRRSRNLDPTTMASWTDVHVRVLGRWFGGVQVRLPRFPFHDVLRSKECPPAGYLVRNEVRMLAENEADLTVRVATFDVVDANSHAYKSGFGAMMIDQGADEAQVNRGLNHEPGSPNSSRYTAHAEEAALDDLIATGQEHADAERLLYGFMED